MIAKVLDNSSLTNLITSAHKRIFLLLPGLYNELAEALLSVLYLGKDLKVILNISEDNIRNGYCGLKAIEKLCSQGVQVRQLDNNLVSFIIVDDIGYLLFPQSRILPGQENLINALKMDSMMRLNLISYYFPEKKKDEIIRSTQLIAEETAMQIKKLEDNDNIAEVKPIDEKKYSAIKENIKKNPVMNPDLNRLMITYTTKLQYVDLSFTGIRITSKKVKIPRKAFPIKDEVLLNKLAVHMSLFENLANNKQNLIRLLGKKYNDLRKKHLIRIGVRNKSIIEKSHKSDFEKELEKFKAEIAEHQELIFKMLKSDIINTEKRIKAELHKFLKENPPDNIKDSRQLTIFDQVIDEAINPIIKKINFPNVNTLIQEMKLELSYSDITYDDLKDKKFIDLLVKNNAITENEKSEIVEFKKAYEVKK
ncbi:MAG: hypothetical protein P9L97_00380 [Candidatus Tenebribacter davisii]|nr:hypothetical protein [Candidatus Tenebribacter davisii]